MAQLAYRAAKGGLTGIISKKIFVAFGIYINIAVALI